MKYEILYPEAFPIIKFNLERDERIKAESDAMISMSSTIELKGKMDGGLLQGLARKFLAGESFFFQELIATRGKGEVILGHYLPGGIIDVALNGDYNLIVQKDGYLASTSDIQVGTKLQNLSKGLLSGEGFFVLKLSGRGTAFLSSYGVIHPINLENGEEVLIDNGHLVAWPDYMSYSIEEAASGWFSSITSGEGFVCRFRGPGTVLIQTRNPQSFEEWIKGIAKMDRS